MEKKNTETPEKVDFDKFANQYEELLDEQLDFFGEENSYFAEYKIKIVKDTIGFTPLNILEFGCGIGRNLKHLSDYFPGAEITGTDISSKSLDIARKENPEVNLFLLEENEIQKYLNRFDLIFISCVFHHIHPSERENSISIIKRMLKQNGVAYIFEHNPYNPVTKYIVRNCAWDTDAILLNMKESVELMKFAKFDISEKNYTLFFPKSLNSLRFLETYLSKIPMGGQYYVKGIKKE